MKAPATREDLHELRLVCREYPRSSVIDAVDAALRGLEVGAAERRGLATLVAAWLLDEEADNVPPPLTADAAERIGVELYRRAH